MRVHIIEARCKRCNEAFNPLDMEDLEHLMRADGQECGGQGEILGTYHVPKARKYRPGRAE